MVGNVNDTAETDPRAQMAGIFVEDNVITSVGQEFKGSPGVHSYCMRQSSISHNRISQVAYTGISFNWPNPQGPKFDPRDQRVGYSHDNIVYGNDVSRYMSR